MSTSSRFHAVVLLLWFVSSHGRVSAQTQGFTTQSPVGQIGTNVYYTPANQLLTPAGIQVELPRLRPQALALSPDSRLLVTAGKTAELIVIDPRSGEIFQHVPLPPETNADSGPGPVSQQILEPDKEGQISFTGLAFSAEGSRLYLANVDGSIKVFSIGADKKVVGLRSLPLPQVTGLRRDKEIPAGIAVSPDGKRLYVALNLANRLAEMDAVDGRVLRLWDVGVAPYDVKLAGSKIYVSNWGGRRPDASALTGPAGQGTTVRVDPVRYIANEGSVSVIDISANSTEANFPSSAGRALPAQSEIVTGLRASAMALSPNHRWLVVANSGSDTVSVIDTRKDQVVENICVRQNPADLFGAQPNALAFDSKGRTLFVCNGSQNAVAVVVFDPGESKLQGLIPVGWFPGAIVWHSAQKSLCVANIKGIGSTKRFKPGQRAEYNSHQHFGTVSLVPLPTTKVLKEMTRTSLSNLRYGLLQESKLPARADQPPRPVPERVGEPSVFKHVVYIIKENRTYDQVLGDMKEGNGNANLCVFGARVTPNQHRLTKAFVLLDNTYCSGVLSADGHEWADTALVTDYLERSFASFPRSYPDGLGVEEVDALAYSPAGFIWDNVIAHGRTLRDYGEFSITEAGWKDPEKKEPPKFMDYYHDFTGRQNQMNLHCRPAIESLRPYLATNSVGWDLDIPDVFRAAYFIEELKEFERKGDWPNLIIMSLPNDHTSGTKANTPTPAAQVADNDLAFGQIVEAITHSRFWPETCIFAIEDDPQDGWDHVSGYRTTAYVVSPYTRRGAVVSTQYNQTSVLRTIELILGLPPMNQFDATATPMSDCFSSQPDLTPFLAVRNNIPLDQMNPPPKKISDPLLRKLAYASASLPLDQPDRCPEDLLNRILWHAMKGSTAPYPVWAVHED